MDIMDVLDIFEALLIVLAIGMGIFAISLMVINRRINEIIEGLSYERHLLTTWLFAPLFRFYFWILERMEKLDIKVNAPIPWDEKIVFAGNHSMPKMQDTFLLPVIIFFLRLKNYFDPVRYLPLSTADGDNFVKSLLFKILLGDRSLIAVNRNVKEGEGVSSTEEAKRHEGGVIFYVERGRTQTAEKKGIARKRITREGETLVLGRPRLGAATVALETGAPIVLFWSKIEGDYSYPRHGKFSLVWMALWGLWEIFFNPELKVTIDINHPTGAIRPLPGEDVVGLTKRIENGLFELGEYQLERIKKSKKK